MITIVLYRPEKPSNVGNIMRTCSATDSELVIIGPLSFDMSDKSLKRAGMDYISTLKWTYYDNYDEFLKIYGNKKIYYVTRYSKNIYSENDYSNIVEDVILMFGRESTGIPHDILRANYDTTVRLPMVANSRSLNLSNCVAIMTYEVLRQQKFFSLATREEIKGEDFLEDEIKDD